VTPQPDRPDHGPGAMYECRVIGGRARYFARGVPVLQPDTPAYDVPLTPRRGGCLYGFVKRRRRSGWVRW
jgi:hypothetical protein